jgi:hypothetical protein
MTKATSNSVQPCPVCGSVTFNPLCAECVEVKELSLLFGAFDETAAITVR